ncbi:MAG: hypothetical protein M1818_002878 [Claussenomyces sp. TS43310]|nr:MAG: hypothetical protein M1818_002878 [Claussenomyces sp. TS43310]
MPIHGHPHPSSSSAGAHHNAQQQSFGAVSGLLQATHTLGSVGAPAGTFGPATSETTAAGTDALYPRVTGTQYAHTSSGEAGLPSRHRAAQSDSAIRDPPANSQQQFDTPVRSQAYGSQLDELHLSPPASSVSRESQRLQQDYFSDEAPRINLEQTTPETSSGQNLDQVPGALQSGPRLESRSSQAAPQGRHLSSAMAQDAYSTPTRPALNHNYSRSSPSGFEGQSFTPFSNPGSSSEAGGFAPPVSQKYTPQGQPRNVSNTPLGLADIRPRADSNQPENLPGSNPYSYDGANATPTNSNYLAPWAIYAFDWCKWPSQGHDAGKVAVGSYLEDGHNFIQILESHIVPSPEVYSPSAPKYGLEFSKIAEATHSYPVTRLLWEPPSSQKQSTDLLATSGDHLRLWSLPSDTPMSSPGNSISRTASHGRELPPTKLTPLALLSNSKTPEHTAPLTSLDWNTVSPSLIITSSIDTTCTIWDIPTLTAKTQLIAHDKEVFDVRFCANSVDVFVSCGADGSVRMFDLRSLEHSTIIYEPTAKDDKDLNSAGGRISPTLAQQTMSYAPPLLRLAASPHDTHLLATFSQDSKIIRILDVRQPGQALLELHGHGAPINCIEWSPSRRGTLASGADDSLVLVWDLLSQSTPIGPPGPGANGGAAADNSRGPAASWRCDYEVGNVSWAPHSALSNEGGDWLGVSGGRGIWGVKL